MIFLKNTFFKLVIISTVLLFSGLGFVSCSLRNDAKSNNTNEVNGVPEITFDTLFYDFGDLVEGEKAAFTFIFKNTGTANLLIFDAYSSCGCTIPNFSKKPVAPGEEGKIEVVFDSENRSGLQNKIITLKTNLPESEKSLWIKANVKSK